MTDDTPLSPRQEKYVSLVLSGLSETEAARRAGYGVEYPTKGASRVSRIPMVKAAIQEEQAQLREKAKYDVEQAVVEIDKAINFGYEKSNPMSVAKLLELKSKLFGLLIDRVEVATVDLVGAIGRAEARVINLTPRQPCAELGPVTVDPALNYYNGPGRKGDPLGD